MRIFLVRLYEIPAKDLILKTMQASGLNIRKEKVMFFRMLVFVIPFALLSPFQVYASTATQTDWSGGDGIWGPVFDWGSEFYTGIDIECYHTPSNIILQKTISLIPLEHTVDGDYTGAWSVYSADVNGDGCLDVLGTSNTFSEVTWWDLNEFLADGSLESSVLDVQESPDWQTVFWNCTEPSGTGVALQVRASDNSSSMGPWSDTLTAPCTLEGILADEDNYFQYRVILSTTDPLLTSTLHDVTVDWQPFTGKQEGSAGEVAQFALFGAQPNPAIGHALMFIAVPFDSGSELTVYDLSGRVVHSITGEYCTGVHEVLLEGLASGMYMVRMTSEEFTATQQFVMID